MAALSKANLKVIFGTMTIGKPGIEMTRVHSIEETNAMVDAFQKFGHNTLDTARVYGEGTSEEYLGALDLSKRGIQVDTKLYPTANRSALSHDLYHHTPEDLRADRSVPFETTVREVDKLHKEGHFERWGMSNFQSWEVARICEICEQNNWQKPSVVQGHYNAFHRAVEAELFPCIRHYGLSFYCFNPLAGGFLTGQFQRNQTEFEPGSRFDPTTNQGRFHRVRYFDDSYFDALDILRSVASNHGFAESECALRWLSYHSMLKTERGDGIVIGASSLKHLEENLEALEKGPLPEDVVKALDDGWLKIRGKELKFWH